MNSNQPPATISSAGGHYAYFDHDTDVGVIITISIVLPGEGEIDVAQRLVVNLNSSLRLRGLIHIKFGCYVCA